MKILKAIEFAWNGMRSCFETETNFKVHLGVAFVTILLSVNFHISVTEWLFVTSCITAVITLEMLNTALEALCDVVKKDFDPGIKKVKDIAAAAVLVAAMSSVIIGAIIFIPKIIALVKTI